MIISIKKCTSTSIKQWGGWSENTRNCTQNSQLSLSVNFKWTLPISETRACEARAWCKLQEKFSGNTVGGEGYNTIILVCSDFHGTEYKNTINKMKTTPQQEHITYVTDSQEEAHQSRNNICFALTSLKLLHFLLLLFALCSSFCTPQQTEIIQDKVTLCDWTKIERLAWKASQRHANLVTFGQ